MHDFAECLKALDEARKALKLEGRVEWRLAGCYDEFRNGLEPMPSKEKLFQLYGESLLMQEFLLALVRICNKRTGPGSDTTGARNLFLQFSEFFCVLDTACLKAGDLRAQAHMLRVLKRLKENPTPQDMPEESDDRI